VPPRLQSVAELNTTSNDAYPWLTPDGRTIYFTRELAVEKQPGIYRATRPDVNSPFGPPEFVCSDRHAVLSADQRCMVALGGRYRADAGLFQKCRDSDTAAFEPLSLIEELKKQPNPKSPWLTADGLTLIFQRADVAGGYPGSPKNASGSEFVICRRTSPNGTWSDPQRLPIQDDALYTAPLTWPMLTEDGLTLFFCIGGTRLSSELAYATRAKVGQPFHNARKILVDGKPLTGRAPRYIGATRELFFDRDSGSDATPENRDLWVLKNFSPAHLGNSDGGNETER
jgi:hypothetical protein